MLRDPHHLDTDPDPDPTFVHFDADADPDPARHFDADPDPSFHFDADHFDIASYSDHIRPLKDKKDIKT